VGPNSMQDEVTNVLDLISSKYDQTFDVSMDQKRRLQIPKRWRSEENGPEEELRLLSWLTPDHRENCILVLPPRPCADMAKKISSMPAADPSAESLRRWFGGNSARVMPDKSGRITIPDQLAAKALIEPEIGAVLVGMNDRFQIWSPELYKKRITEDEAIWLEASRLL